MTPYLETLAPNASLVAASIPQHLPYDFSADPDGEVKFWVHYVSAARLATAGVQEALQIWEEVPLYCKYIQEKAFGDPHTLFHCMKPKGE